MMLRQATEWIVRQHRGRRSSSRGIGRWTAVLMTPLLLAAVVVPVGQAAAATPAATGGPASAFQFSVQPYAAPGTQRRSSFTYELQPSHQILDQVVVLNKSNAPESFLAYPEDATNIAGTGSYGFQERNKIHNVAVGKWLTIGNTSFTVPPGKEVVVTFQLSIPTDAPPGDHVGAVVVQEVSNPNSKSPLGINVVLRFAVPMFVEVVGPLHASLTIEHLTVFHQSPLLPFLGSPARVAVRFNLVNTGNAILDPRSAAVSITGLFVGTLHAYTVHQTGGTQSSKNPLPHQMLPGAVLTLTEEWNGLTPFLPLTAHVSAQAVDPTSGTTVSAASSSLFWYIPWLLILIILLLIALIIARFTVLRPDRRKARRVRRQLARQGTAGAAVSGAPGEANPAGAAGTGAMEEAGR